MEVVIVEGERAVLGVNMGRPIVTNGAFATRSSQITLRTCLSSFSCRVSMMGWVGSSRNFRGLGS